MNTGEIIKYFRLARNMTQEQLAQDAEISFSTLRKYEANERNPKYEQLSKIADALGISVNLFMDFEIQSVSDLFSILFKMEGQADLEIATSKDLAVLSEDALFLHFKNGYMPSFLHNSLHGLLALCKLTVMSDNWNVPSRNRSNTITNNIFKLLLNILTDNKYYMVESSLNRIMD